MSATGNPGPAGQEDRRSDERIQLLGELNGEVMVFQPMAVIAISRSGVQVETSFPFQLDSLHELRLTLGERSIVLKGRVVYCNVVEVDQERVRYRSGFQFVDLSDRVLGVIVAFVDTIRQERRAP